MIVEEFKNITVRELEELSYELSQVNLFKSHKIQETLNQLYYIISDVNINIIDNKIEEEDKVIFEK